AWLISTGLPESDPRRRRRRARARLSEIKTFLERRPAKRSSSSPCPLVSVSASHSVPGLAPLASNFCPDTYLTAIRRAVEYVHAGDCFQVNVAQRLLFPQREHPLELYGLLRQCNAAPFAGYFDLGEFAVASASPERFLFVQNGEVETRPIKGTRPRGLT